MRQISTARFKADEAYYDSIGDLFRDVYLMYGLESAIFFLRTALSKKMPISQINIIALSEDLHVLTPICSTNPGCSIHQEITPLDRRPRYIRPDASIKTVLISNNLSPYKEDFNRYFSERGTCFAGQEALLRVPFHIKAGQTFLIQFWSQMSHAFSQKQAKLIEHLLMPFIQLLDKEGLIVPESMDAKKDAPDAVSAYELLCRCNGLTEVLKKIVRVAGTKTTVLVTGETGVGKEMVADTLHELSERKGKPLIKVNCGAISESLVDSELFGHEKGSFTGAISNHAGYFEQAHTGTLFLDEISELPLSAQVKLLRVLDNNTFQRVGSSKLQAVDVRLITASNRNLADMVRQGLFRKDLYYRLSMYPVHVPALRERREDILPLAEHFAKKSAKEMEKHFPSGITQKELEGLCVHTWPGNVRELRNVVYRAMINYVSGTDLSQFLFDIDLENSFEEPGNVFRPPSGWPTLGELEQSYITAVLRHTKGKMSGTNSASSVLGIHYTTLRTHLRRMGKSEG